MKKTDEIYLQDVLHAIVKIEQYLHDFTIDLFLEDSLRQDAVIRQLEIVGEAINRLSSDFLIKNSDFPIREAKRTRDRLIHHYDDVNPKVVWQTVQEDLPLLRKQIQKIFEQ